MELQHTIDVDNGTYTMTPANASASWVALKNALKLAKNINLQGITGKDTQEVGVEMLKEILANLGSAELKALEDLVWRHTVFNPIDGQPYRLSDKFNEHFNTQRGDLVPVLVQGVKYQFADFFTGGALSLAGMLQ